MSAPLLSQVRQTRTLGRAWRVICQNGRRSQSAETRREIEEFAEIAEARLARIQRQLNQGAFKFGPARGVPILKTRNRGIRPLVVAPIESRIVQRAIHDVLLTVPEIRRYAENPYSFGGVRKPQGDSIAAVPAAIQAVLDAIGQGATYVIRSDISSFFTRIPKHAVTDIVESATGEPGFVDLFRQAIAVELDNIAKLRERAGAFPIYEIGVAQGNSLSPLLGNILLYDFDRGMNAGTCRCLRYVDDFIVLAPDRRLAEAQLAYGVRILGSHGLETSHEKTFKGPVSGGFEFLGIEIGNGLIRPSKESRKRLIASVSEKLGASASALRSCARTGVMVPALALIRTLYQASGVVHGWGSHYRFCNDKATLLELDRQLDELLRRYLGGYSSAVRMVTRKSRRQMIGVPELEELASRPLQWPKPTPTVLRSGPTEGPLRIGESSGQGEES